LCFRENFYERHYVFFSDYLACRDIDCRAMSQESVMVKNRNVGPGVSGHVTEHQFRCIWRKCIAKNAIRFPHASIRRVAKSGLCIHFDSVIEEISVRASSYEMWPEARFNQRCFDDLTWFDVEPSQNAKGLRVCSSCNPKTKYASLENLYAEHCFEALLEWSSENLRPELHLGFYRTHTRDMTWATIGCLQDMEYSDGQCLRIGILKIIRQKSLLSSSHSK